MITTRIAGACIRRPWWVLSAWAVVLAGALASGALLLERALSTETSFIAEGEATAGKRLLEQRLPGEEVLGGEVIVVRSETVPTDDPRFAAFVSRLAKDLAGTGEARPVPTAWAGGSSALLSQDGKATLLPVTLVDDRWAEAVEPLLRVVTAADADPDFHVTMTGLGTAAHDFVAISEEDLETGELFGLPAALLILLIVFRSVVAGLLPLALALVSVVVTLGLAALIGQMWNLSFFLVNMVTAMGLALGIDYSLFLVSRYRDQRRRGSERTAAVVESAGTAGTAVLFSGLSFVVALSGLFLVPDTILRSLAVGAVLVGLVTVAAALTLLPAILILLGDRIDALPVPIVYRGGREGRPAEGRAWSRIVLAVMRHPGIALGCTAVTLVLAAVPVLGLRTGTSGLSTLPEGTPSKEGFVALEESFPGSGGPDPAVVVIDGDVTDPAVVRGIRLLQQTVADDPRFGEPSTAVHERARLTVVKVPLPGDPNGTEGKTAVKALRTDVVVPAFGHTDVPVLVTGSTAFEADYATLIGRWLPVVIAFVLGLTVVLLTLVFRSVVLPIKAVLFNLLSVGAAYGLLVLVFQEGYGADLLGFTQVDALEPWVPVFLFSVLFALSMDYHVFLLSRIRECWAVSGDTTEAVAEGIVSTARLITGAALIIVVVFGGFALGELVGFQQMGFGVGVALLLDATLVRSVVVPASMALLGSWNWYLPRWLKWLPELQVEHGRSVA